MGDDGNIPPPDRGQGCTASRRCWEAAASAYSRGVHSSGLCPGVRPSPHRGGGGVCQLLCLHSRYCVGGPSAPPSTRPPTRQCSHPFTISPSLRPPVHPSVHPTQCHSRHEQSGPAMPTHGCRAQHGHRLGQLCTLLVQVPLAFSLGSTPGVGAGGRGCGQAAPLLSRAVRGGGSPLAGPFLSSRLPRGPAGGRGKPLAVGTAAAWWVPVLARRPGPGCWAGSPGVAARADTALPSVLDWDGGQPHAALHLSAEHEDPVLPTALRPACLCPWSSRPPACPQLSHYRTAKTHKQSYFG